MQSFLREREEGIAMPVVRDTRPSQDIPSKIEEAKNRRDWLFAVVYSAIHIERQAYFAVKSHIDSLKTKVDKNTIVYLSLPQLAFCLLALRKIEKSEYETILQINKVRIKFVHRREHCEYKVGTRADREYGPLIEDVLSLLKGKLREDRVFVFYCKA